MATGDRSPLYKAPFTLGVWLDDRDSDKRNRWRAKGWFITGWVVGWPPERVDEEVGGSRLTEVSGPSAPVSRRDTTPSYGEPVGDINPVVALEDGTSYTKVENEGDLCGCDPEHKETQTVQRSKGASSVQSGGRAEMGPR